MKTTPTETDREAASNFVASPGMRVWWRYKRTKREIVGQVNPDIRDGRPTGMMVVFDRGSSALMCDAEVTAIDTDDPATVGVMLAQVEQLATLDDIMDRWPDVAGDDRWMLIATVHETQDTVRLFAPTLGALMVAAMKALKGAT